MSDRKGIAFAFLYNRAMESHIQDQVRQLATGVTLQVTAGVLEEMHALGLAYEQVDEGVRLAAPLELLDASRIGEGLAHSTQAQLSQLDIFWRIGSTNTWLLERVSDPAFHGNVCLAEQQVAGKGRRGRHWVSPFGKNIYMSIGWSMMTSRVSVAGLSLVIGMAVVSALRELGLSGVGLKWPNDVIVDHGKLAGILVEMAVPHRGEARLVIGLGVNLLLDEQDAAAIDQRFSVIGRDVGISRNELVAHLLNTLVPALARFQETGFAPWAELWQEYDVYHGSQVLVRRSDDTIEGINRGVDQEGNLLLETSEGVQAFNAGEVSLRPVNQ